MNNDLLLRFKRIYEESTSYKVSWSKLDLDNNNLTVGIVNAAGEEIFILNVREYPNGQIYWF